jgi:hypothetical protein
MMKTNSAYSYLGIFFLIAFLSACVKDTDFDQANDIVQSPIVELDLIYFDLPAITFYDTITSSPVLTVSDTTALPFLNDQGTISSLIRAEFYFKVTNSIQRDFQVLFEFLNEQNGVKYTIEFTVNQGTVENPVVTEYFDNVEGEDKNKLTKTEKVAVSVTIPSYNEDLDGTIKLESKTTYYLEF